MSNMWTIYNQAGSVQRCTVKELEYHGEWMGDEYVSVTVKSDEPVDFHFGDYLTYRGEVFTLNYDPNVVKKARSGSYGEGFTYENVRLFSYAAKMKVVDFKDVVLEDNGQAYTSLSEFSFFASSVEDLADRLQANLNRESEHWRVFTPDYDRCVQRMDSTTGWGSYYSESHSAGETDVNVEVTKDDSCWSVLGFSYTKFGIEFYVRGRDIVIGGDPVQVNSGSGSIFQYGKGKGLYEIERTSDDNQEIITKLFAYGSEKNMPLNYYANLHKRPFVTGKKFQWEIISGQTIYSILTSKTIY